MLKGLTALEISAQCSSSASRNCLSSGVFHTSGACGALPASGPGPAALARLLSAALMLPLMAAAFSSWNTSSCKNRRKASEMTSFKKHGLYRYGARLETA